MRRRLFVVLSIGLLMGSSHAMAASGVIATDAEPSPSTAAAHGSPDLDENVPNAAAPGKNSAVFGHNPWLFPQFGAAQQFHPFTQFPLHGNVAPFGLFPQLHPFGKFPPVAPFQPPGLFPQRHPFGKLPPVAPFHSFGRFFGCPGWGGCGGPGWFPGGHNICQPQHPIYWDQVAEGDAQPAGEERADPSHLVLDEAAQKKLDDALKEAKIEFYEELYEELYDKNISDRDFEEMFEAMSESEKKELFKGLYPFPKYNAPHVPPYFPQHPGCGPCSPCSSCGGGIPGCNWCGGFPGCGSCRPHGGPAGPCGPGPDWGIWGGVGQHPSPGLLPVPCWSCFPTAGSLGRPFHDQDQPEELQTEDPTTLLE